MDNQTASQEPLSPVVQYAMNQQPTQSMTPDSSQELSPVVRQAMGQDNPNDVTSAQQDLGSKNYNDLCEKFVEQKVFGKTGIFKSAADAWNTYVQEGYAHTDLQKAPAGSLLYFAPDRSNGQFGHTAIYMGNGRMIGATDNGVQQYDVSQWMKDTGQTPLGYVMPK